MLPCSARIDHEPQRTAHDPHESHAPHDRVQTSMTSITRKAVQRVYQGYAPIYDLVFGHALQEGRRALAQAVAEHPPARLLEVGVGTGLLLPHYPAASQVCGIDLSLPMLRRARSHALRLSGRRISLLASDAEALPFPDACFDAVTLPYVLSVTPRPELLLQELARVCRPGGRLYVLNHFKGAGWWRFGEGLLAPITSLVGFRSTLPIEVLTGAARWRTESSESTNLLGLSRLVIMERVSG